MRIGIDMMGGDFAPGSTIGGSILARKVLPDHVEIILVGAIQILTTIPGIIRRAIAAPIPDFNGNRSLLLDVGLNPDARPDVLYQYGSIGAIYSRLVHEISEPKVALLNIGREEDKGNMLARSAYQLMKESLEYDFIGNFEANELFVSNRANVIVTDGFVGNMVLKEAGLVNRIKEELDR